MTGAFFLHIAFSKLGDWQTRDVRPKGFHRLLILSGVEVQIGSELAFRKMTILSKPFHHECDEPGVRIRHTHLMRFVPFRPIEHQASQPKFVALQVSNFGAGLGLNCLGFRSSSALRHLRSKEAAPIASFPEHPVKSIKLF